MKKLFLASAMVASFVASCGGGGSSGTRGDGFSADGFYTVSLTLTNGVINSPAVAFLNGKASIPEDTIEGEIILRYEGSLEEALRLKGSIKQAVLCIGGKCIPIGIAGALLPGQSRTFKIQLVGHKYEVPWIVINPYEDELLEEKMQEGELSAGHLNGTDTDSYFNLEKNFSVSNYPLVPNTLRFSGAGTFKASTIYTGYTSAQGTITVKLVKGINTANSIVKNTFVVKVGTTSTVCVDDGNGNIVQQGGGTNCSGTIDYTNGTVNIAVNNVSTPQDLDMSYQVNGSQLCYDDGQGKIKGDCTGTVDYSTGAITYRFSFDFVSIPVSVPFNYLYQTGTADGLNYEFVLPSDTVDPNDSNLKYVYGDWIGIYLGKTLLCSTDGTNTSAPCQISREGRKVKVKFDKVQSAKLKIVYSLRKIYDFNPAANAKAYGHKWNGKSEMYVEGEIRLIIQLEDGTELKASSPITFYAYPKQ